MRKLILASLTISAGLPARTPARAGRTKPLRGSLEHRLTTLLDQPPFDRATWGVFVQDDRGRVLYQRNADRYRVPASNTKLVVTATATVLLPADYRVRTSLYTNGRLQDGVLYGDLVLYGRGDPTWSERCYSVDTLAPGACDSTFTVVDRLADSVRARGIRRITGKVGGDGSSFERTLGHPAGNAFDLNWWVPDPNLYAARALAAALQRKGVSIAGGAAGTTDSLAYRAVRCCSAPPPLAEYLGRPLGQLIFPILNSSQNWFAEMLLKILGRELRGEGSWEAGLDVERRFLIDSVKIDSTAFGLEDGSGLAAGNLITPRALVQLLAYMRGHAKNAAFLAALPHSAQPGSLLKRFVGTPLEGHVAAKTGSIDRVNSLSGFLDRPDGRTYFFSVQANAHSVPSQQMLARIDSVVVEIGKTK